MFSTLGKLLMITAQNILNRMCFSRSSQRDYKVSVIGAAGGVGQPLGLLLKLHPMVTEISMYDIIEKNLGITTEISHINTRPRIVSHVGPDKLKDSLKCADVVIHTAGKVGCLKPGMTRDDMFDSNATLTYEIAKAIACHSPSAVILCVTNPINSAVPIIADTMKLSGKYDPRKVLGVTTIDVLRACTFVSEINRVDPECVSIPVVGGHSGPTIIPLFSQCMPLLNLHSQQDIKNLTKKIQEAGSMVVKEKGGFEFATLSMAYATVRLLSAILHGFNGCSTIPECAFVDSDLTEAKYFSTPLLFGREGIERNLGIGGLNEYESGLISIAIQELKKDIAKGEAFVKKISAKK